MDKARVLLTAARSCDTGSSGLLTLLTLLTRAQGQSRVRLEPSSLMPATLYLSARTCIHHLPRMALPPAGYQMLKHGSLGSTFQSVTFHLWSLLAHGNPSEQNTPSTNSKLSVAPQESQHLKILEMQDSHLTLSPCKNQTLITYTNMEIFPVQTGGLATKTTAKQSRTQ